MKAFNYSIDRTHSRERGFTLLEILIVITILGILASLVAVRLMDKPDEARILKAELDIKTLENALKLYKLDNAFYPSTEQGLRALVEMPSIGRIKKNGAREGISRRWLYPKTHGTMITFT